MHLPGIRGNSRVFGGLMFTQAFLASEAAIPGFRVGRIDHRFLRPGICTEPLEYEIAWPAKRIATVRVLQAGKLIATSLAQECVEEGAEASPSTTFPNGVFSLEYYEDARIFCSANESSQREIVEFLKWFFDLGYEVRLVETPKYLARNTGEDERGPEQRQRTLGWLRFHPSTSRILKPSHCRAVALLFSDWAIGKAFGDQYRLNGIPVNPSWISSMHHTAWLHPESVVNPGGWFLSHIECTIASFGRGRAEVHIFNEERLPVVSAIQEVFIQVAPLQTAAKL